MDERAVQVLIGYDGSVAAGAAVEAGARLVPAAHARVCHLWTPPFASEQLRRRLWHGAGAIDAFVASIEREGRRQAEQVAGMGVALAQRAGWTAEPSVVRCYGGEGFELSRLAHDARADLVAIGARGLSGARAVLGSVSDMVVHYATCPVLVVPYPLLEADDAALAEGPVLVAWDGSAGAVGALEAATALWPGREVVAATVDLDIGPPDGAAARVLPLSSHREGAGGVADALVAGAHECGAAVLVVGSRGRSAVAEIVLGSVAMRALHRAHRPVLVVPPAGRGEEADI